MDVFVELSKRLDNHYRIVLVGIDKNTSKQLPQNIHTIERTNDVMELVRLYSLADVLVNPTREDNFPTVNLEAIACGTPVVTFDTGGSSETIDNTCGIVVPKNDIDLLLKAVKYVCQQKQNYFDACLARSKSFDRKDKFEEYVRLYENLQTGVRK